jgi:hypothetical protein
MLLVIALTRYGEGFTGSSAVPSALDETPKAKKEVNMSDARRHDRPQRWPKRQELE